MSSNEPSEPGRLDLERDVPTTPGDVRALRECRACTPSWLDLTADEIDALLPETPPDTRPNAAGRAPFSLE